MIMLGTMSRIMPTASSCVAASRPGASAPISGDAQMKIAAPPSVISSRSDVKRVLAPRQTSGLTWPSRRATKRGTKAVVIAALSTFGSRSGRE